MGKVMRMKNEPTTLEARQMKYAAAFIVPVLGFFLLSCGDESPPGVDLSRDGSNPPISEDGGGPDICARPAEGCDCADEGQQITCRPNLDECRLGLRTCSGGLWTACVEVDYDNDPKGIGSNEQGLQERIGTLNDGDGTDPYDACEICQPECVVERDYDFADPSTTLDVCVEHRTPKPRSLDPLAPRSPNSGCYQELANIVVNPDAGTDGALVIDPASTQGTFARVYEGCHLGAWPKTDWHELSWEGLTPDDSFVTLEIRTGESITEALADTPITLGGSSMTPLGGSINIGDELVKAGKINGHRYLHLTFELNLSTTGLSPEVYGFEQKFYCQDEAGNLDPGLCSNGNLDEGETNADCGGICGPTCISGDPCVSDLDCDSAVCSGGACTGSSCTDNVLNGGESDIDCGAVCVTTSRLCIEREDCFTDADCQIPYSCLTGVCTYDVCLAQTQIPVNECQELVDLYNATGGGTTWTTDWPEVLTAPAGGVAPTPCSWAGIQCSGGNVGVIRLNGNNLTGSLPGTWLGSGMPALTLLDLNNNSVGGAIPESITTVTSLQTVYLHDNALSGSLPATLGNMDSLQSLWLRNNNLSGSIPTSIGQLGDTLTYFEFGNNQFSGSLPAEMGNLTLVTNFYLYNNALTGPIPASFGNLASLVDFRLNDNQLSGEIPAAISAVPPLDGVAGGFVFTLANNQCLYTLDPTLYAELNADSPGWEAGCAVTAYTPACANVADDALAHPNLESDVDCGRFCALRYSLYCQPGQSCVAASDCDSATAPGGCSPANTCVECQVDADCSGVASGAVCQSNVCVPLTFTIDPYVPDPTTAGVHILTGTTNAPIGVLPTISVYVGGFLPSCTNVTRPTATTWQCELTTDPTWATYTVYVSGSITYNGDTASASDSFVLVECLSATDCDDGIACTTDACTANVCSNTLDAGNCFINNSCWLDGDLNTVTPNPYEYCSATLNPYAWSNASCFDGYTNGVESDIDCGGANCGATCLNGQNCNDAFDCQGGVCNAAGQCETLWATVTSPTNNWVLAPGETFTISGATNASDGATVETLIYSPYYNCGTVTVSGGMYSTTCTVPLNYPLGYNYSDRYIYSGNRSLLHYTYGEVVECTSNAQCDGLTPTCNLTAGSPTQYTCVQCAVDADCGAGAPICDTSTGLCAECITGSDCDDGNACTADICNAGVCANDASQVCTIGGTCYISGENRPDTALFADHDLYQHCDPSLSTSAWSGDKTLCTSPVVDDALGTDFDEFLSAALNTTVEICDGFESGSYDSSMWNYAYNVSATVGSYRGSDGQLTAKSPVNGYAYLYNYDNSPRTEQYVHARFYVNYPSTTQSPELGTHYNIYESWGATIVGVAISDNDELLLGYPYGGYQGTGVKLPHNDSWACVQVDIDLATGNVRLGIDGSQVASAAGSQTAVYEHDIGLLPWSTGYSKNAATIHFDEFVGTRDNLARSIPCDP